MLRMKSRAFWIAFPLTVTAVSILGVSQLRRHEGANSLRAPSAESGANTSNPTQPSEITIPAKTEIEVRLDQSIATNRVVSGDPFSATVATPVLVSGQTVIPEGSPVQGKIISVHEAGRLKGVAELRLALESVDVYGNSYDIHSSTFTRFGHNHEKRNWEIIGGGSVGGTLLGALAGGGKGALIGMPIGAGAGVTGAALTGKKDIVIPAETAMTFQLIKPVEVRI